VLLRGYLERARVERLSWPLPRDLSETGIEGALFPRTAQEAARKAVEPDWAHIHRELRRKGVTLSLLWEEYRADHPALHV